MNDQELRRRSRIQFDKKNDRVKSTYLRSEENTSRPKGSKFMFDIFNDVPLRASIIRDQELDNFELGDNGQKLHRQKSANFRFNQMGQI